MINRVFLYLVTLLVFEVSLVCAQEAGHSTLLDAEVELGFVPESAMVLVLDGGKLLRYQATIVSPFVDKEGKEIRKPGKWLVGARVPSLTNRTFFAVLIQGKEGELAYTPLREHMPGVIVDAFEDPDSLHRYVQERKALLNKNLSQKVAREGELGRLQADVDVIADIGRIVEVREESLDYEENLKRLEKDEINYEASLKQVSSYPQPRNYLRRESELNRQLIELNAAAKHAEEQLKKREGENTETPAQKQAVIDSVKGENEQALAQKLGTLRRYRMELEGQQGLVLEH